MIGIAVAEITEWESTKQYFKIKGEEISNTPFGEYFIRAIFDKDVVFYNSGYRKTCASAAAQYMIDKFNLKTIIVLGTCAGIDFDNKLYDIIFPSKAVQYDCTVKSCEPLIKERYNVLINLESLDFEFKTGIIGTADRAVVDWNDYIDLKDNQITIADMESASIAYICKLNNVGCLIIKGITDFPREDHLEQEPDKHLRQYEIFLANVPIVMNKIFDNYLEKVVKSI